MDNSLFIIVFQIVVLVYSVILHEMAHGFMAVHLGDPTPKLMGRLSLNPLRHLDPFGSVILPIITSFAGLVFGYAKPVQFNPRNIRDFRYGGAKIALAGPAVNLALALMTGLLVRYLIGIPGLEDLASLLSIVVLINLTLGFFNLVPIPPLDGHHIIFAFLPAQYIRFRELALRHGFVLFLIFIFFIFPILQKGLIYPLFSIIIGQ